MAHRLLTNCATRSSSWAELESFARTEKLKWPLEPTLEAAFEVFSSAYNATTAVYGGKVSPSFHEGAAGSLASVRSSLFNPAATCSSGISTAKMPLGVTASAWYPADAPHSLLGSINEGASKGWVEFTLALPSSPSWEIGGLTAVPEMSPLGPANHTILLDGKVVQRWSGPQESRVARHWSPGTKTTARTLRIESETHSSWVDWVSISVYVCATSRVAIKHDDHVAAEPCTAAGQCTDNTGHVWDLSAVSNWDLSARGPF